jgi:hypothetical protein
MAKPKAPAAPRQDVPPPPAAPLDRTEVEHGLRYVHLVGEGLRREVRNGNTSLYALLDVLIAKGVVSYREMDEARAATEPIVHQAMSAIPPIRLAPNVDKYDPELPVRLPCADKMHACQAACCHMVFALSAQDLQEGGIRWDLYMPYQIARRPDGACVHLGDDLRCTIHDRRPAICRAFDCRKDRRIWDDFDRAVRSTGTPDAGTPEPETPAE